jgi:Flp pilus assembly protein TadD
MIRIAFLGLIAASSLAVSASAAPNDTATARNAVAVRSLESFTRVAPSDGGAFIELAQAYLRDNRAAEAATAYRRALSLDNVMMVTPNGDAIWSHDVARRALTRVVELSAR